MYDIGKYRGKVIDYGIMPGTDSKNPQVFIEFELLGRYGPTGELAPCLPGRRTYFKAVTPNTVNWLIEDLKTLGYDRDGLKFLDPSVIGAADLYGHEADLLCEHEVWQGNARERWSIFRDRHRERANADELAALDARYADEFHRAFGGTTPPSPPLTVPNTSDEAI